MTQFAERFGWAARAVSAGFIGALALAAILFLGTPVAQASDFLVTTTMDSVDNNLGDSICANALGQCSLRAAIQNANKNPDADTIRLKPGTYTMSLAGAGEDSAATGDIDILSAVSIIGVLADGVTENPDASQAIIDGAQIDRIFSVGPYGTSASFNATFENLTLRNGRNTTSGDAYGGAMDSGSSGSTLITIDNLIFEDNYATQDGGAIYMDGGTNRRIDIKNTIFRRNSVTNGSGGAVQFSLGVQYDIFDSAFESNTAQFGSAISVNAAATGGYVPTINRTTFSGNTANTSGTLYLTGPTAINNSTISGNSAAQRAGGIRHGGSAGQMLTLRHVTVTGNTAGVSGSGIEVSMVNTTLEMHNSIIAGNTGGTELIGTGAGTGTALISASSTNNLVGNGSNLTNGVNGNKTGIGNPGLGTLTTDPGSKGKIHIPVKGGLAHNTGNNAQTGGLTTDQRGQTRVVGTVDIGAVEVQLTPTTSTLSSSANPSTVGQSVTFTATVTGAGGAPTGTVTFKDGATTIGTATLSAGTATFTTSALSAGSHSITAAYGGDADFASSTSATLTQTVNKAATTTAVTSSVNPAVYGQTVTLTANVTSGYAGTISGTVTFMDGAATLGTGTLSGGSATWTGTLAVGSHAITAVYSGDGTYNGSTGSGLTQTVNKAATATGLTSSKNPSLYNQNVLFTASITVTAPGAGTPTGTVTFKDGATVLGTPQPVSGGHATLFISDLAPGIHSITAVYNGDGNLATSTSSAVSQVVESATTSTTVTTSASPSPLGDTVTFTATVTDGIGDLTPTGTVTFKNGGTTLGTGTLNGSAQATFSTTSLPIGTYTITAEYAGDATFLASSGTVSQEITKGVSASAVSVSDTTPVYGQSVTLTATVTAAVPANGTPTGTVTFTMDGTELGTATLSGAGTATLATPALTVGNRSITAAYSGDTTFAASSSAPYALTVAKSPTSTAISAAPNPSEYGQSVTFTATVNVAGDGAGTVTGSVLFMEESTTLGTVPLTGNTATYTISSLSPGPAHKITAHYTGDANFDASASGEASQVVNPAVSTTVLTSSKSTSAYGESVRLTATITSAFGSPADGTVTFYAGSTPIGTAAVVAGAAILDKTDLPVGTYDLKATFSGNATATSDESDPVSQTVTKAATTADLDVTPLTASVYGEWVTFVAWVTPAHTGVPTGSITFMDGDTVLGVEPLDGSATASFVTADLPVGSHQFKAVYGGDGNFVGASSSVAAFTVSAADTDVALVVSPNPTKYGDAVTFTATLTVEAPGTGTPGGEVIFKEGATELGRATLAGGTASFSTTSLSVGSHSVTAEYAGSTSFAGSATAAAVTQVVEKGLTTTTIAGLPNPSVYGQTVTLKATVTANTAGTGTPAGTVKFMSGAAELGQATLNGSGVAELPHVFNLVGTTSVEAVYQGDDSRFAPSTSTALSQVVNQAATGTALTVDLSNPTYGDSVTLTATVTATAPGGGTPTGTVMFMDGVTSLGTKSLVGGSASLTINTLGAGAHSLTAVYSGSGDHVTSTSAAASLTVAKATLTATLTSSYNPGVYGQGMDFTATLTPTGGVAASPAGVYDLMINGAVAVTDNPIGWDAVIARSVPTEGVGDYEVYFIFKGDANYLPATSNTITQKIVKANTTTAASAIAATVYGQPMTFTATIDPVAPSIWRPDGDVQILNGTEVLGQGTVYGIDSDTAEVQVTVSTLPVGTHTLTVKYLGSTNFNGSSTTISHTVNKAGSAVTLVSSDNTSNFGETITLTATASATGAGSGTPAGEVIFNRIEGGVAVEELGRAPLVGGTASIDIATLSVGNHQLRAEYSGNPSFLASQSDPLSQTVAPATTTTTLIVDDAIPVYSQAVTFTATVAPTVAAGIPGGKVTFKEGATILAADVTLDAAGKAQFTTSALGLGSHNITVSYAGDANYAASDSVAVTVTVDPSPTTTTLSSDSATSTTTFGENITITATLSSTGGGTPDGTVTFKDGATSLGTANLVGGTASLTTAALGGGVHNLTAVYNGTGNYVTSTSTTLSHTVNRATVTPVITSLITAPAFGQNARFSIAVTPDGPATATPTGAFAVLVNGTPQPDGTLSGGVAEVEVSGLIVGTHTIGLAYQGDANYAPSNAATISVQVQKAEALVTLSQDRAATVFGQSVTFTAEVTAKSPSQARPTGKVQFTDGNFVIEVPLTGEGATTAKATFPTSVLEAGTSTMRAVYTGDAGFVTATSADLDHTVNKADTAVTVDTDKNPSKYGENVTLTATVTAVSPGSGTPHGLVTFRSGTDDIGTGMLIGGVATIQTTTLAAKSHSITATYSGDPNFNSNDPGTLTQVVEPGITSTALTADVASPVWGQPVTFTATVTPAIASGIPGGTVTFKEGATVLAADVVLDASGNAQFTTAALTVGSHTITAVYAGAGNYAGSTSDGFSKTIGKASAQAILIIAPSPSDFGEDITFTAELTALSPGAGLPTGTVTFKDGDTAIATGVALNGSGVAQYTAAAGLATGTHTITAVYSGDGHFTAATSSGLTHEVQTAPGSLSFANLSASYGSTATLTATLLPPAAGKEIQFTVAGTNIGSAVTNAAGVATKSYQPFLTAGPHTVAVSFTGDADIAANDATGTLAVTQATGTVTVAAQTGIYRSNVTLEATLAPVAANRTITFSVNGTVVGSGTTDATGKATYTYFITAPVGSATIDAAFAGDAEVAAATGAGTLTVSKATGVMVADDVTDILRRTVTLRAVLAPAEAGLTVTFKVGATTVGTGTTDAAGVATTTYTLGNLQATETITASFAGNANILTASGTATLTTNDTKPVMNAISAQTNKEGETVDFTVSGSDADGDALTFSILDAPPGVGISASGRITGTIGGSAAADSPYTVTVKVTDALAGGYDGDTNTTTFTWTVVDDTAAPTWDGAATLNVSAETQTGLTLTWDADATDDVNVTAYRIFQDDVEIDTVVGTTYNVTGLTKNTLYTFRVEALDLAGNVSSDGPAAQGLTALGAPDLAVSASKPFWLKANETISLSFPGQPGVTATYSLAYNQSTDGTIWAAGTPVTGSLTAGAGTMPEYAATITVPADTGLWKDLVLTVTATDRTGATTTSTETLTWLIDTIAPAVTAAETGAVRPLKGGESFTVSVTSEAGLAAAKVTIGGEEKTLTPVDGTPTRYTYTYHVGATENRTVAVAIKLTDAAGNVTEQALTPVVLDNTLPVITSVTLVTPGRVRDGKSYYIAGESLTVEVVTEPGLTQVSSRPQDVAVQVSGASLSGFTNGWLHLTETGAGTGIYRGTYVIQPGDTTGNADRVLSVTVSDLAGNVDSLSGTEKLVVDTQAPEVLGVDHDARNVVPTGTTVRLTAWGERDLYAVSYKFTLDGGEVREGALTQIPTSPGIYEAFYTVQPGDTTPAGGAPVEITLEKVSGNKVTRTVTHMLAVDTAPPVMSAISVMPASGSLNPGETLTISFTGEPGLTAAVTVGDLLTNVPMTESPAGTYTASYLVKFGDRAVAAPVTVTARDAVGNKRIATAAATVTVKAEPPTVNVDLDIQPDGKDGWYVTKPVLTFRVDAGSTLTLKDGAATVALGTPQQVDGFDAYIYRVPDGEHNYTYQAVKGASLPATGTLPVIKVDTAKPLAPTLTSTVTATKVAEVTLTASWRAEDGVKEIELFAKGRFYGKYAVTGSSAAITVQLQEGVNTFTAMLHDQAGNVSPVSAEVSINRDTTAPTFDIAVDVQNRRITITPSETLAVTPALTVQATTDGAPLTVSPDGAPAGGVYKYRWAETIAGGATVNVLVTGSDAVGNAGSGHWVSTRLVPARGGKVESGTVSAQFPPGALADGVVLMSSYSAGRLTGGTYVPPGTQLMGVYEFDANLMPGAKVAISFELEFTGTLPPTVGVYHLNVDNPTAAPTYVPGTMTILSTRTVTDSATGSSVTVYKVRIEATLPHFSVWAPFVDGTAPEFTSAVLVNGAAASGQALNTPTVTVTGAVDGTARTVEASLGGPAVAAQDLGALTAADKSFSLSVPLGADGAKTITVKTVDEFGNWRTMDLSLVLDTQAPAVTNLKVGAAAYTPGTTAATTAASIRFSGSTDGAASLTVNGPTGTVIGGALIGFDVNLNLNVGDNTYTVVATDAAGNQSTPVLVVIRRDNTPPVASLTGINPVTPLSTVTFGYTVNEEVKSVVLAVNGGATLSTGGPGAASVTLADQTRSNIQLTFPGKGTYSLTATVTDLAGNESLVTQSVTMDDSAPQVSVALSQNPTRDSVTMTVTGTISGVPATNTPITIYLRGSVITPVTEKMMGGTYTYTFNATDLLEGQNAVMASLVGANAVSGSAATVITKDTVVPSATSLVATPPRSSGNAALTYSLTEAATAQFQYSTDSGATWTTAQNVSLPAGSASRVLTLPADGTYQFQLVLTDAAGNTQTLPFTGTVTVDKTNPVITPTGLPAATGSLDLSFGYSVNESVSNVTIASTGGATLGVTTSADQTKSGISLHFPADGTYTVTITATDLTGNMASVARTIVVDSKLPVITASVSPALTRTGSTLTVTATVGGAAIANDATVSLVRNGQKVALADDHPSGGTFTHSFTAGALDEGDNVIEITVTRTNNLASGTSILITKDSTPPDATALAPSATVVYNNSVTLNFTLSEAAKVVIERRKAPGAWTGVYTSGATFLPAGPQSQTVTLPELGTFEFRITMTDVIDYTTTRQFPSVSREEPLANQPPTVVVNASETLTRSDKVLLSGTATPSSEVTINLGNQQLTSLWSGASGTFQYEAALAEGANQFTVAATRFGMTTTATITVTRDTTAPNLALTAEHPTDVAVIANLVITTEPGARAALNGEPVSLRPDGTARVAVQLAVGSNEFTVTATDAVGNAAVKSVTVIRKEAGPVDPDPRPCTAAGGNLTDITGHWAEEAIRCLVDGKIVTGFPDNTFRPETTVSRAQFMVMLGRALGLTPDAEPVLPFTDSDEIQTWAQGYISALYKAGLVRGDAQGTFRPEAEISRAELAVLMARVLAYKGIQVEPGETQFTDQDQIPAWALDSLRVAVAAGLINGFEDGSFQPAASATRGQSAVLIRRLQLKLSEQ